MAGSVYDNAGNLTNTTLNEAIVYDANNRQTSYTSAGSTTTYHYDAQGNRVKKSGPAGTSVYVYDAFNKLAAEYSDASASTPGTFYRTVDHTACCSSHVTRRSAPEVRQDEARAAWRAEAYVDRTVSTASKRNDVMAVLWCASAVRWEE